MSRQRTCVTALGCGLATLFVSNAWAAEDTPAPYPPCDRQATESETAAAQGAFQAGQGSFNEADYQRAITYWDDAYRRDCNAHALLLNLARAYELNGQKKHAVLALQTYNERNPGSSQRAQNEKRIGKLQEAIAAEAAGAPSEQPEEPVEPEEVQEEPQSAAEPSSTEEQRTWAHWTSLAGAGVGVVMVGIGIPTWVGGQSSYDSWLGVFDPQGTGNRDAQQIVAQYRLPEDTSDAAAQARAQSAVDAQYSPPPGPDVTTQEGQREIEAAADSALGQRDLGVLLTVTGGALAVVGTTLFFVLPKEKVEHSSLPRVVPVAGPGFGGLFISGQF